MALVALCVVGRIEADPSHAREPALDPGVALARRRAAVASAVRPQITRHVTGRDPPSPQDRRHDVSVVLAHALAALEDALDRGIHGGRTWNIIKRLVEPAPQGRGGRQRIVPALETAAPDEVVEERRGADETARLQHQSEFGIARRGAEPGPGVFPDLGGRLRDRAHLHRRTSHDRETAVLSGAIEEVAPVAKGSLEFENGAGRVGLEREPAHDLPPVLHGVQIKRHDGHSHRRAVDELDLVFDGVAGDHDGSPAVTG